MAAVLCLSLLFLLVKCDARFNRESARQANQPYLNNLAWNVNTGSIAQYILVSLTSSTFDVSPPSTSFLSTTKISMTPFLDLRTTFDLRNITEYLENLTNNNTPAKLYNVSEACLNATSRIYLGVVNKEIWAIKVFDAAAKPETGLFTGNLQWLGSYSECLEISKEIPASVVSRNDTAFGTQYCKIVIANSSQHLDALSPFTSLRFDMCMPSSCSEEDVRAIINSDFLSLLPNDIEAVSATCLPKERPLTGSAVAIIVILCCLGFVLVIATAYDLLIHQPNLTAVNVPLPETNTVNENTPLLTAQSSNVIIKDDQSTVPTMLCQVMLALSMYSNGVKLLKTSSQREGTLAAVHGIRFISMSWVMLGHVYVFVALYTRNIAEFVSRLLPRWTFQAVTNATVSVDSFFLISGTLVSYLLLKELKKVGGPRHLNWLKFYVHRYWRLTPAYMILLALWSEIYIYLGSGPLWADSGPDPNCKCHWWHNLLFINNLFDSTGECMGWSWYLANDMQFYIISPLFLVPLFLSKVWGLVIINVVLVCSLIITGVVSYHFHIPAGFASITQWSSTTFIVDFNELYLRPWCRIGPYLIGILLGCILQNKDRWTRLPRVYVLLGWASAAAMNLAVLYGLYDVSQGHPTSIGVAAFYNSVSRVVWSLGLAWVIFACVNGHGGFVNKLLSWPVFVPLSRLTYMAYLVHPIIYTYFFSSREHTLTLDDLIIIIFFLGLGVLSYGVAFVLSVTLESPMMGLEKVLLSRFSTRTGAQPATQHGL